MEAQVKADCRWRIIQSGGREYIKTEWRRVPKENEAEALRHPDLNIRENAFDFSNQTPVPYVVTADETPLVEIAQETHTPIVVGREGKRKAKGQS